MTDTLTPAPPGIRPCQGCETGIKNGPDNLCEACRRQAMGWLPPTIPGCVAKDPCAAPDDCRQLMCPNLKARSHHADGNRNPATTNVPTPAPPGTETAAGGYPPPTYPPKTDDWKDGYRRGMAYCLATLQPLMNDDHGITAVREAVRMLHGQMPTITPAPAYSGFAARFLSDAGKDGGLVRRKPADIDDAPDMIANPPVTEPEGMRQPPAPEPMCMWRETAPCAMGRCVYRACPDTAAMPALRCRIGGRRRWPIRHRRFRRRRPITNSPPNLAAGMAGASAPPARTTARTSRRRNRTRTRWATATALTTPWPSLPKAGRTPRK